MELQNMGIEQEDTDNKILLCIPLPDDYFPSLTSSGLFLFFHEGCVCVYVCYSWSQYIAVVCYSIPIFFLNGKKVWRVWGVVLAAEPDCGEG